MPPQPTGRLQAYQRSPIFRRGQICVRSVRDGEIEYPFLARTFSEVGWSYGMREKVLEQSQRRYGRRREVVEECRAGRMLPKREPAQVVVRTQS